MEEDDVTWAGNMDRIDFENIFRIVDNSDDQHFLITASTNLFASALDKKPNNERQYIVSLFNWMKTFVIECNKLELLDDFKFKTLFLIRVKTEHNILVNSIIYRFIVFSLRLLTIILSGITSVIQSKVKPTWLSRFLLSLADSIEKLVNVYIKSVNICSNLEQYNVEIMSSRLYHKFLKYLSFNQSFSLMRLDSSNMSLSVKALLLSLTRSSFRITEINEYFRTSSSITINGLKSQIIVVINSLERKLEKMSQSLLLDNDSSLKREFTLDSKLIASTYYVIIQHYMLNPVESLTESIEKSIVEMIMRTYCMCNNILRIFYDGQLNALSENENNFDDFMSNIMRRFRKSLIFGAILAPYDSENESDIGDNFMDLIIPYYEDHISFIGVNYIFLKLLCLKLYEIITYKRYLNFEDPNLLNSDIQYNVDISFSFIRSLSYLVSLSDDNLQNVSQIEFSNTYLRSASFLTDMSVYLDLPRILLNIEKLTKVDNSQYSDYLNELETLVPFLKGKIDDAVLFTGNSANISAIDIYKSSPNYFRITTVMDLRNLILSSLIGRSMINNKIRYSDNVNDDFIKRSSLISEVNDIFPELGEGYIDAFLKECDDNPELVISKYLEGNIPLKVINLDHSLTRTIPNLATRSLDIPTISEKDVQDYQSHFNYILQERRDICLKQLKNPAIKSTISKLLDGYQTNKNNFEDALSSDFHMRIVESRLGDMYDDEYDDTSEAYIESNLDKVPIDDVPTRLSRVTKGMNNENTLENEEDIYKKIAVNSIDKYEPDFVQLYEKDKRIFSKSFRKTKERAALLLNTGLSNEQIEGWFTMMERDEKFRNTTLAKYEWKGNMVVNIKEEEEVDENEEGEEEEEEGFKDESHSRSNNSNNVQFGFRGGRGNSRGRGRGRGSGGKNHNRKNQSTKKRSTGLNINM